MWKRDTMGKSGNKENRMNQIKTKETILVRDELGD